MAGRLTPSTSRSIRSKVTKFSAPTLHYDAITAVEASQIGRIDCVARPIGGVSGDVWDFEFPPQGDGVYLNMNDMVVHGKAKVVKDGGDLANDENVALVNNFGQSAFSSVEGRVNDFALPGSGFTDTHLKAYVSNILTISKSDAGLMENQIFYPDPAGQFDSLNENHNSGFKARKALIVGSREFDFTAPINCDFLKSSTHLGPGNKLSLRLYRASDSQLIMGAIGNGYKVVFTSLNILYSRIITNIPKPTLETHIIPHTELMRFPKPADTTNIMLNVQSGGKLPRAVIVFFIETVALNGSYTHNMLKMENLGINSINLRVNGRSVPADPLKPNFTNKVVARELNHLFQNVGVTRTGRGGFIDRNKFLDGYTIFPFDLSPDKCSGYHIHETFEGTLEVEATCTAMNTATTAFAYLIWDMEVSIDRSSGAPGMPHLAYVSAE